MRLINTSTLRLEEFPNETGLEYAILSHRWEDEEVSFYHMQDIDEARLKKGFQKIEKFCQAANRAGYHHAWVDTCCIDKSSSAELSEAINSMYRWYERSKVCYAYLSDVDSSEGDNNKQVRASRWFKRGWTLQELLAPLEVRFFDQNWQFLGTKQSLEGEIENVTGIRRHVLKRVDMRNFTIAERMSWAAERQTTRPEDRAYSLMGLFNVNMPMLYGEGEKAFLRLQEEIFRRSEDNTIFVWTGVPVEGCGLFASSPDGFILDSHYDFRFASSRNDDECIMTSKGLLVKLSIAWWALCIYVAEIRFGTNRSQRVGIFLRRLSENEYVRFRPLNRHDLVPEGELRQLENRQHFKDVRLYVRQDDLRSVLPYMAISARDLEPPIFGLIIKPTSVFDGDPLPSSDWIWDSVKHTVTFTRYGAVAKFRLQRSCRPFRCIQFGYDFDSSLYFIVTSENRTLGIGSRINQITGNDLTLSDVNMSVVSNTDTSVVERNYYQKTGVRFATWGFKVPPEAVEVVYGLAEGQTKDGPHIWGSIYLDYEQETSHRWIRSVQLLFKNNMGSFHVDSQS